VIVAGPRIPIKRAEGPLTGRRRLSFGGVACAGLAWVDPACQPASQPAYQDDDDDAIPVRCVAGIVGQGSPDAHYVEVH
jgi:hypothetical protein